MDPAKFVYASTIVFLPVLITIVSFIRDREHLLGNISFWFFVVSFVVTLTKTGAGLVTTLLLLTVSPALHLQLNSFLQPPLHALNYPGVESCTGFLAAWACRRRFVPAVNVLKIFPSTWLLVLHGWIAASAIVAVAHNIWQSGSEFALRGLFYNIYLLRHLSWHDDYFPLHDLFAYSVAVAMVIAVWTLLQQYGRRLFEHLLIALFCGFAINAGFALWQKIDGVGWIGDATAGGVNAFWPDLHSFSALMVLSLLLGYGYFRTQRGSATARTLVGLVMLLSGGGLFLSGSRSAMLIVCMVVVVLGGATMVARGRRRVFALIAIVLLVLGVDSTLRRGYRGLSYQLLRASSDGVTFSDIDKALSFRPGIWQAALRMYSEFPWFGLGQGSFYRLGSIQEFSNNSYLVNEIGENAHNYLVQTFVELGPIGLILILVCCLPIFRQGRNNLNLISFYALLAILLANLFAHALLVREMLMLCSVFLGTYYWQIESSGSQMEPVIEQRRVRVLAWAAIGLVTLVGVEVAHSFHRFPFVYGQRCFTPRTLDQDGWTRGLLQQPIPDAAVLIRLGLSAAQPNASSRPLVVEIAVIDSSATAVWSRTLEVPRHSDVPFRFAIELPRWSQSANYLSVRASHCYVPLNLGVTYDSRTLGVHIDELRFETADGRLLTP